MVRATDSSLQSCPSTDIGAPTHDPIWIIQSSMIHASPSWKPSNGQQGGAVAEGECWPCRCRFSNSLVPGTIPGPQNKERPTWAIKPVPCLLVPMPFRSANPDRSAWRMPNGTTEHNTDITPPEFMQLDRRKTPVVAPTSPTQTCAASPCFQGPRLHIDVSICSNQLLRSRTWSWIARN